MQNDTGTSSEFGKAFERFIRTLTNLSWAEEWVDVYYVWILKLKSSGLLALVE